MIFDAADATQQLIEKGHDAASAQVLLLLLLLHSWPLTPQTSGLLRPATSNI